MKPNKPIMIFGVATMTFITSYFAYTQATTGTERGSTPKKTMPATNYRPKLTSFWLTVTFILTVTSDKQFLSKYFCYCPVIFWMSEPRIRPKSNFFRKWPGLTQKRIEFWPIWLRFSIRLRNVIFYGWLYDTSKSASCRPDAKFS